MQSVCFLGSPNGIQNGTAPGCRVLTSYVLLLPARIGSEECSGLTSYCLALWEIRCHPPFPAVKFVLIEKESENSIMCSLWFDRNAVICPHVIKIKFVLLSNLAACKALLMRMKPQFWAKKYALTSAAPAMRERGASDRLLGQTGVILVWVTITRKDIGGCSVNCFTVNSGRIWCMGIMERCLRTGSTNLFLPSVGSTSYWSEVFVCQQDLI